MSMKYIKKIIVKQKGKFSNQTYSNQEYSSYDLRELYPSINDEKFDKFKVSKIFISENKQIKNNKQENEEEKNEKEEKEEKEEKDKEHSKEKLKDDQVQRCDKNIFIYKLLNKSNCLII